jgi:phosphonate transport system substrate-binding protein
MTLAAIFHRSALSTLLLLMLLVIMTGCNKIENRPKMKIGYMNCNNEEETTGRFTPMTRYLSEKTGVDFEFVPVDTNDFEKRFKTGEFAFTHSNSILYVILKEHHDLILLASEKRGKYGPRTAGTIIVRKDSGITKLSELKGKRIAFGPMLAPTGYMAEYDLLLRNGIDPETFLGNWTIPNGSYKHEKIIYKVLYGEVDAGAAPVLDIEVMSREGKISQDDFVILGQSPLIPYCTFGAAKNTDPKLVEKVRKALLDLKPTDTAEVNGERVKVMKAAWIDGFEELTDKDYDPIREMAKRVNMPPYQKY